MESGLARPSNGPTRRAAGWRGRRGGAVACQEWASIRRMNLKRRASGGPVEAERKQGSRRAAGAEHVAAEAVAARCATACSSPAAAKAGVGRECSSVQHMHGRGFTEISDNSDTRSVQHIRHPPSRRLLEQLADTDAVIYGPTCPRRELRQPQLLQLRARTPRATRACKSVQAAAQVDGSAPARHVCFIKFGKNMRSEV